MSESVEKTSIKEFDPGSRKLLFYGYIVRVIGDLISYVAGIGYILTGLGWLKCYTRVIRRNVFIPAGIIGFLAGIIALYNAYTGLTTYTMITGELVQNNMTLSHFRDIVKFTADSFTSFNTIVNHVVLGFLFIIDGLAILYLMKEYKKAFNAFTWILLLIAGLSFFGTVALAPHVSDSLTGLASRIDLYISEYGDQPISHETAHFVLEYTSIIMPIASLQIIGVIMRIIGHILAILGFNRIPKIIEKMKMLSETLKQA